MRRHGWIAGIVVLCAVSVSTLAESQRWAVWKGLELSERIAEQLGDEARVPGELGQSFPVDGPERTAWSGGRGEWLDHQWSAGPKAYNWALARPVRVPDHKNIDRPIELYAWDHNGRQLGTALLPDGSWKLAEAGDGVLAISEDSAYVAPNFPMPLVVQDIHYFSSLSPAKAVRTFFGVSGSCLSPGKRWLAHQDPHQGTLTFSDLVANKHFVHKASQVFEQKPVYLSRIWDGFSLVAIADDGVLLAHDGDKLKLINPAGKALAALTRTLDGVDYRLVQAAGCYHLIYKVYDSPEVTERICLDGSPVQGPSKPTTPSP